MEIMTLHENKWLSLKEMKDPENGVHGYVYSHETRCNGEIVAILPYKRRLGQLHWLLRKEITPCWEMAPVISSITGGVDIARAVRETAQHELLEEAGYAIGLDRLVALGTCYGTKSSDTTYHLYTADLSNVKRGKAVGDGSELEAMAHCFWSGSIDDARDPFVYIMYYRIMGHLIAQGTGGS